jgi:putative aldouronate transport system permease protein
VLISGILIDLLSPSQGILNQVLVAIGMDPVYFLGDAKVFPFVLIFTDVWKNFGFGSIIFLAALTNIDPALYEAATVDGANRFQRLIHVSLPGMVTMIAVVAILNLGGCLNGMFDQVYNLYSPITYETGDIIDTFTYRLGLIDMQFSPATAFGLLKSVVTAIMVSVSYYSCYKFADYRIF